MPDSGKEAKPSSHPPEDANPRHRQSNPGHHQIEHGGQHEVRREALETAAQGLAAVLQVALQVHEGESGDALLSCCAMAGTPVHAEVYAVPHETQIPWPR